MQILGSLIKFKAKGTNIETLGHIYHIAQGDQRETVYHVLTEIGTTHQVRDHELILEFIDAEFEEVKPLLITQEIIDEKFHEQEPTEDAAPGLRIAEETEPANDAKENNKSGKKCLNNRY